MKRFLFSSCLVASLLVTSPLKAIDPWIADKGDSTYQNPLLFVDYPDPDCIRVADTYYAVSSSFSASPGLPLLRSKDLVNWKLVGHALPSLVPHEYFSQPRRGDGVWAPSIRHHDGLFWIFYPDPDFGIYIITAKDFEGPWSEPRLIKAGKGLIDPCPLWDDDGRVYMIHGWARSRSGINNVLTLCELSADTKTIINEGRIIIDGNKLPGYRTLEGPKIYKRGDTYWVFAPAGGVEQGWQSVFRSKDIWGPYEDRIVLEQGSSPVNGPHQGAWIDTPTGEHWFLHFQDRGPFGRIPHLQPMKWRSDGWPVMGQDADGDGKGIPVLAHAKPDGIPSPSSVLAYPGSDEFETSSLAPQWQWECNPPKAAASLSEKQGALRLFTQGSDRLWDAPNILSQPVYGPASTTLVSMDFSAAKEGERAGLVLMGREYTWLEVTKTHEGFVLRRGECKGGKRSPMNAKEVILTSAPLHSGKVFLRLTVKEGANWSLDYSEDGRSFETLGESFPGFNGWWVGSRVGLFSTAPGTERSSSFCDFDYVRVEALR